MLRYYLDYSDGLKNIGANKITITHLYNSITQNMLSRGRGNAYRSK